MRQFCWTALIVVSSVLLVREATARILSIQVQRMGTNSTKIIMHFGSEDDFAKYIAHFPNRDCAHQMGHQFSGSFEIGKIKNGDAEDDSLQFKPSVNSANTPTYKRDGIYSYKADLTDCFPKEMLRLTNTLAGQHGPNCFNAAMLSCGLTRHQAFWSEDRLGKTVNDPQLFHSVTSPEPGDIGVIYESDGKTPAHAFYVVAKEDNALDTWVFTKNGLNKNNPYRFMRLSHMAAIYDERWKAKWRYFRPNTQGGYISHYAGDKAIHPCTLREDPTLERKETTEFKNSNEHHSKK